jgi:DNA-binding transcriptional ArsR family regulator
MPNRPHVRATPDQIRAMVHPLRMRIVDALRDDGPLTATRLAEMLGESSGATSYHLRVLAEAGVIEEDTELGNARERWWRRATLLYIPTDAEDPSGRAVELSARHLHLSRDEEALRQFVAHMDELSTEWRGAAFTGNFTIHLTAEEVFDLGLEILERIEELRGPPEDRPPDAKRVSITFRALPWFEESTAAGGAEEG